MIGTNIVVFLVVFIPTFAGASDSSSDINSATCPELVKKGCYRDPGAASRVLHLRTLQNLVAMYPKNIDWGDGWNDGLEDIACFCAKQALKNRFSIFGVQHFKECWAGNLDKDFFQRDSEAGCWGVKPKYSECNDSATTACVGPSYYNYIYEIKEQEKEKINICEKQAPCQHGECIPHDKSYLCRCEADYEGVHCEKWIDNCEGNPCKNGKCNDGINSYDCECNPGYTGVNCETDVDDCAKRPCINGKCVDGVNSYECKCNPGYEGKNCEKDVDDCAKRPCINGKCVDGVNSYECKCNPGYEGNNCEKDIDDCASSPCIHGKCIDEVNSYRCKCNAGYEGKNCFKNIDDCVHHKCLHGNCVDSVNSYRCQCNFGYTGEKCELVNMSPSSCSVSNWWSSFDKKGWSTCRKNNLFITQLYRGPTQRSKDPIYLLEEAKCCKAIPLLSSKDGECLDANWWKSLDKKNSWGKCPSGYFLSGLYRTSNDNLHNIEEGRCCRPKSHADWYERCYDENIATKFNNKGWTKCMKSGYYITGVHRDSGTDWLKNIDKFRCCQMTLVTCSTSDWTSSFDKKGWSTCGSTETFITGFYRSEKFLWWDEIYRLEKVRCCSASSAYKGDAICRNQNWWKHLDKKRSWAKCPSGYFLNGLYRTSGNNLHNIEEGKCCRPKNHPTKYDACYDEDIKKISGKKGWMSCSKPEYYVTGVYRHDGDSLDDLQKITCCKMVS